MDVVVLVVVGGGGDSVEVLLLKRSVSLSLSSLFSLTSKKNKLERFGGRKGRLQCSSLFFFEVREKREERERERDPSRWWWEYLDDVDVVDVDGVDVVDVDGSVGDVVGGLSVTHKIYFF